MATCDYDGCTKRTAERYAMEMGGKKTEINLCTDHSDKLRQAGVSLQGSRPDAPRAERKAERKVQRKRLGRPPRKPMTIEEIESLKKSRAKRK